MQQHEAVMSFRTKYLKDVFERFCYVLLPYSYIFKNDKIIQLVITKCLSHNNKLALRYNE